MTDSKVRRSDAEIIGEAMNGVITHPFADGILKSLGSFSRFDAAAIWFGSMVYLTDPVANADTLDRIPEEVLTPNQNKLTVDDPSPVRLARQRIEAAQPDIDPTGEALQQAVAFQIKDLLETAVADSILWLDILSAGPQPEPLLTNGIPHESLQEGTTTLASVHVVVASSLFNLVQAGLPFELPRTHEDYVRQFHQFKGDPGAIKLLEGESLEMRSSNARGFCPAGDHYDQNTGHSWLAEVLKRAEIVYSYPAPSA